MLGFTMRTPKTLPAAPTENELRAVLAACPETLEGTRNHALVLVLAGSGLPRQRVATLSYRGLAADRPEAFRARREGPQGSRGVHRSHDDTGAQSHR